MGKELFQTDVGLRSYDRAHVSTSLSLPDVYPDRDGFGALRQPPQRKPIEFEVPPLLDHVVIIYLNSPRSFGAAVGGGLPRPLIRDMDMSRWFRRNPTAAGTRVAAT